MSKRLLFLIIVILPAVAFSQSKEDRILMSSLKDNILFIQALSKYPGHDFRESQFLETQFQGAGLLPAYGKSSFLQPVIKDEGIRYQPGTTLFLSQKELVLNKDFIPLPYSGQGSVTGDPLIAVQEANLPWIMDISQYSGTQLTGTDTDMRETMYKLAMQAVHDKATAVLFYNSDSTAHDVSFDKNNKKTALPIPAVYINYAAAKYYFKDQTADAPVSLQVHFFDKKDTVYNVLGELNNHAASTIVFCAFQPENKAALMTLISLLKDNKHFKNKNYRFVCIANPDGAKYYFNNPGMTADQTDCILFLNRPLTGDETSHAFSISGINSSPEWENILRRAKPRGLVVHYSQTENLPANVISPVPFLTISPGLDNPDGEFEAVKYLADLVKELNRVGKLTGTN